MELDSAGNLWSIRILGYEGFTDPGNDRIPTLDTLISTLRSGDPDRILELVAPDAEVSVGDSVWTFQGPARDDIEDPRSPLSQLLYGEENSLASFEKIHIPAATLHPRPHETNSNVMMYSFPETSPVKDIVLTVHAGRWRIWEVHLAR